MDIISRINSLESKMEANKATAQAILADMNLDPADAATLIEENEGIALRIKSLRSISETAALPYEAPKPEPATKSVADRAEADAMKAVRLPAGNRVTNFAGATQQERALKAYRFGQWFLGGPAGNAKAASWCRERGIEIKGHNEFENEVGGFLVPEEFLNDLIDLREQYGVFRRLTRVVPMTSDTQSRPRRKGGLTAFYVGEGASINESELNWDRVRLVTKKLGVIAKLTAELNEDSTIEIANTVSDEIAYAFANAEDNAGFNGDGTSTYGGIVGVREKLKGLDGTIANIAGLVVGSGNAYSELVLSDFRKVVGRLPQYADGAGARWIVHRSFFHEVMCKLAEATGGVTSTEIINGIPRQYFMGYPVEFAQVMPKDEANSQVCCLLGDLRLGSMLGDRRDVTLALSEHAAFTTDELTLRGTQRYDINVHDVGNASGTASLRQPGPIVGLITAAS